MRARQSGVPAGETAPSPRPRLLLQGDARARSRGGAGARRPCRLCRPHPRPRLHGARRRGNARRRASTARSPPRPNDSDVWTDVARFRRSSGDLAGALEAADRAVAARPRNAEALALRGELTRGQYGLAAAIPWFDRALEVDPRQCRGADRARRDLWRHGPDERHARRRAQGPPPRPAAIPRAYLSGGGARRARPQFRTRAIALERAPAARSTTRPAGMLLLERDRLRDRQ